MHHVFRLVLSLFAGLCFSAQAKDGRISLSTQDFPGILTNSGSYVLSESVVLTQAYVFAALSVQADFVTIDLNGHAITKKGGTGEYALFQGSDRHALHVRNGSLSGFDMGVRAGTAARIENVRVSDVNSIIVAGPGAHVRDVQGLGMSLEHAEPLLSAGAGSFLDGVLMAEGSGATSSGPPFWTLVGEASLVHRLIIQDLVSSQTTSATVLSAGMGSVLRRVQLGSLQSEKNLTGLSSSRGIVSHSSVDGLASVSGDATGIRYGHGLVREMQIRLVQDTNGAANASLEHAMWVDSQSTGFPFLPASHILETTRMARNTLNYGSLNVQGGGSALRDNQLNNSTNHVVFMSGVGKNLAIRNSASGNPLPMFSGGLPNGWAQVEAFPDVFFVFTNNPWANLQH